MKKSNPFNISILIFIIISLGSCSQGEKALKEESESEIIPEDIVEMRADQIKMAGIQLGSVEYRNLKSELKVSGVVTVSPQNQATVCMPLGGFIQSTFLIPGNAVRKGQALAVVESQDFLDLQRSYLEARNRLEFAEADFKRHSELYKEDVYSQKNLQQVTADYKSLQAQTRALEEELKLVGINPSDLHEDNISRSLAVTAPISGYIRTVNINIGKFVNPTDVLFEIVNSDHLMLELTMFDKDAVKVQAGQGIRFFINNETEPHDAVVTQTAKAINADKTFKIYASVTGTCENVLPGMYVNAIIETTGGQVASLPADAIVTFDDREFIFVYEKEKEENGQPFTEFRMIEVNRGVSDEGFIEVILPEGFDVKNARVVIVGAYNLMAAKKNAGEMAC
jgi:RND family efflux transporter MFP subunit